MAYKVVWSAEAIISFDAIIGYIQINFSEKEVSRFITATDEKIKLIEADPKAYRQSLRLQNFHYTNILRKNVLVYRVNHDQSIVVLIHFWSARQNPEQFMIS
jgi:plasmid stabilization system protein ParE